MSEERTLSTAEPEYLVHQSPARRERANFLIQADVSDRQGRPRFEQLWARQLGETRFEICCIPFFAYDLALGDEVETKPGEHVIDRVVAPSGHATFRARFGESADHAVRDEVLDEVRARGFTVEWYSERLLAIDAEDDERAQELADLLWAREQAGQLVYETGRS